MDITPQDDATKPISDDQDLAKALAGVLPDEPEEPAPAPAPLSNGLQFEETNAPVPAPAPAIVPLTPSQPQPAVDLSSFGSSPVVDATAPDPTPATSELSDVKAEALDELRPLIDKLNLPAEEKFDAYLLLIRNTDDASLIPAAHAAAQAITDEARKAQALLDVIKEINFLSSQQSNAS